MIVFTRTFTPMPGHLGESQSFARERVAALKSAYGLDVKLMARMGGPIGQLNMVSYHENLSELEAIRRKIIADVGDSKLPNPAPGLLIPGESQDAIWLKL
jgi:hypothetical protein